MVDQKKVRLLTKAAVVERNEERNALRINQYLKSDYISFHMIQNAVTFTIAYAVGVCWYIFYKAEQMEAAVNLGEFKELMVRIGIVYAICFVLFELISLFYFWKRYDKAREQSREYGKILKRIRRLQDEETGREDTSL